MIQAKRGDATPATTDLVGAALRYCAVADWFESHANVWHRHVSEHQAMEIFNRVEAELRLQGTKALRAHGTRQLALQAVGIPEGATG